MKRYCLTTLLLIALGLSALPLRIHYTNDTHGASLPLTYTDGDSTISLGGYAALEYHLNQSRVQHPRSIYLDAGDQQTGTAFAARSINGITGAEVIEVFNQLELDASTLGNHEFDSSNSNTKALMQLADYPFVNANLIHKDNGSYFGDSPYVTIELEGIRIGVLGLALVELPEKVKAENTAHLQILPYKQAIDRHIEELDRQSDLIILLTHLGLPADSLLATELDSRVDLIIGGHSHDWLPEPLLVNGIYICTAGSRLALLGSLDLEVENDRIASLNNRLINLTAPPEGYRSPLTAFVKDIEEQIRAELDQVIAVIPQDWTPDKYQETVLSRWMAEALKQEYAESHAPDIAILNNGGFRKIIRAGEVTVRDMHEMLPFENYVGFFTCSGADLLNFLELNGSNMMSRPYDICQTSAPGWIEHICKDWHLHMREPEYNLGSEMLQADRIYKVVSHDYVIGQWQKYLGFEPQNVELTNELIVDAMLRQVRLQYPVTSAPNR
ncbi:MAG: bifunctional UDP-sugar hydrolase/5'-nucleotidase [Candidatus Cloacimonadota bacterium]